MLEMYVESYYRWNAAWPVSAQREAVLPLIVYSDLPTLSEGARTQD